MERFELHENGLNLVFEVTDEREIRLRKARWIRRMGLRGSVWRR